MEEEVIVEDHEYSFRHQSLKISVGVHTPGMGRPETSIGSLHLGKLPLDGEWSDLSAVFFMHRIDDKTAYELERIQVM